MIYKTKKPLKAVFIIKKGKRKSNFQIVKNLEGTLFIAFDSILILMNDFVKKNIDFL